MKNSLLILACLLATATGQYGYSTPSVVLESTGRTRGFINISSSDFYLGGIIPVHVAMNDSQCSNEFTGLGVEEVEAMLFAIDSINNDPDLLPNITLGYDIRDYCAVPNVAVDEVIDWALTSSVARDYQECDQCVDVNMQSPVLIGVIGATDSRVSAPVASFLRPFEIPQISYGATSPELENRFRYTYFLRTVPPDTVQSQAIVSVMLNKGWNVVSAVHSSELYGQSGMEEFRPLASAKGICLDLDEAIGENFTDSDYTELAQRLYNSSTRVVLLFSLPTYVRPLLRKFSEIQPRKQMVWIATDTWSRLSSIQDEFGDLLLGMIGVAPFIPTPKEFTEEYYKEVTPATNIRDPYFTEYCKSFLSNQGQTCTKDTSIADLDGYSPGTYSPFVIPAVYSFAHGLQDFLNDHCDSPIEWNRTTQSCKGQNLALNTSVLFDYISALNSTLPSTNTTVGFDSLGNPLVAQYVVVNFQRVSNEENALIEIGMWDSVNMLVLNSSQEIQFGLANDGSVLSNFESQCQICNPGEIQVFSPQSSCCHFCQPCTLDTYAPSNSSNECLQCSVNMWGNNPMNGSNSCVELNEVYFSVSTAGGIIIIMLSIFGLICTTTVSIIIGLFFWTNPVIKSFGREQLILVMIGLILSFVFPFFFAIRPSLALCIIRWFGFWFSITLIFAALLVKLIRVTRIFLGGIKVGQQDCIKPWHQVVFTFVIVAGQMVLVVISVIAAPPFASFDLNTDRNDDFPVLIITCTPSHIATLLILVLYDSVLVILTNGLAVFTIRFPKNFNEARNIAFATFISGVVWTGFVIVYFGASNEFQAGCVPLAMMGMAFGILASLILPRLYTAFLNRDRTQSTTHKNSNLETSTITMSNESLSAQPSNTKNGPNRPFSWRFFVELFHIK